jgi:hypothetical protein
MNNTFLGGLPLTCSQGTSPPPPVRHHSPSLPVPLPTLEKTISQDATLLPGAYNTASYLHVFAALRFDPRSRPLYITDIVLDLLQDCFIFACFSTSQPILLIQCNLENT